MRRARLTASAIFTLVLFAAPVAAGAQPAGKVSRIDVLANRGSPSRLHTAR